MQPAIVIIIVGISVIYLARRFMGSARQKKKGNCCGCGK